LTDVQTLHIVSCCLITAVLISLHKPTITPKLTPIMSLATVWCPGNERS